MQMANRYQMIIAAHLILGFVMCDTTQEINKMDLSGEENELKRNKEAEMGEK